MKEQIKLIVAGTRTFDNEDLLYSQLDYIRASNPDKELIILSGTAKGADALGEKYAEDNKLQVIRFYPDWDNHGKAAGPIRNGEMAKVATHCIVFWDGKSKGTYSMIERARFYKLKLHIVEYLKY